MDNMLKQENGVVNLYHKEKLVGPCQPWDEKKKDAKGNEVVYKHYILPKNNPSKRTFIRQDKVVNGVYQFETKTTEARTIGSKLTEEAAKEVAELEARIKAIKADPKNQVLPTKIDVNSEEGILAAMDKYFNKLSPEAQAKLMAQYKKAGR